MTLECGRFWNHIGYEGDDELMFDQVHRIGIPKDVENPELKYPLVSVTMWGPRGPEEHMLQIFEDTELTILAQLGRDYGRDRRVIAVRRCDNMCVQVSLRWRLDTLEQITDPSEHVQQGLRLLLQLSPLPSEANQDEPN